MKTKITVAKKHLSKNPSLCIFTKSKHNLAFLIYLDRSVWHLLYKYMHRMISIECTENYDTCDDLGINSINKITLVYYYILELVIYK